LRRLDIGIAYRENVGDVCTMIHQVAAEMRADAQFKEILLEDVDLAGVENWADSAVVIRFSLKVTPIQQWTVKRWRRLLATALANALTDEPALNV
jgi:moderate conductance mechanosensitive channel